MSRYFGSRSNGYGFDDATIQAVWNKVPVVQSNLPLYKKDRCGAVMHRHKYGQTEKFGWEIDHILPVSQGGTDDLSNLQPLYWENNRGKSDNYPKWFCSVKF